MSAPKRILVVEDDRDLGAALGAALEKSGYIVQQSPSVMDAVMRMRNQLFDCVLLDMKLGTGDGREVIRNVRKDRQGVNFRTPIIVVSGTLDMGMIQEIRPMISDIVVKPPDTSVLLQKIEAAVGK